MANVYVARRRLRVGGRDVMPGDDVPEAGGWRHLPVYVRNGSVALVQTDVTYARGMNQRRPTTGRDDYRKKGLEHWYGEIRYGDGAPTGPVFESMVPDTLVMGTRAVPVITDVVIAGRDLAQVTTLMFNQGVAAGAGISYRDLVASETAVTATVETALDVAESDGLFQVYPSAGAVSGSYWDVDIVNSNELPVTFTR